MSNILIVDDAAFMRLNLKKLLEEFGHKVVGEAENGRQAIKKYMDLKPDLITLDITMPEMDGLEAAKKIIEIDKEAKIIICSAMGQQSMIIKAIEAGAKDFIVKPFNKKRIEDAINKVLTQEEVKN